MHKILKYSFLFHNTYKVKISSFLLGTNSVVHKNNNVVYFHPNFNSKNVT